MTHPQIDNSVPVNPISTAEDAFRVERAAYERLQKQFADEVRRVRGIAKECHDILEHQSRVIIPSVIALREAMEKLRRI